jgi:hypothetical protein
MKSEHRHELETNWLAHHLADFIDRVRPYGPTIFGAIVAAAVAWFAISYLSTSSTARQSEAWNTYNEAVSGLIPNVVKLRESAAEYPDSPMQQWADITWADGQVWMASRAYIQNRAASMEALNLAEGAYTSLLAESDDPRLINRAHYGLARVYELRNDLEKAREEYARVEGDFKPLAELRVEELAKPQVKATYDWLATAEAPRRALPAGPGTPGQRPDFSAGDLEIPTGDQAPEGSAGAADVDLFQGLGLPDLPATAEDRYGSGTESSAETSASQSGNAADVLAPEQPAQEAAP